MLFVFTPMLMLESAYVYANIIVTRYYAALVLDMLMFRHRFTMPVASQLMALDELGRDDLELFLAHMAEGSRPKLDRMKEVDNFLEDKRVRCHQVRCVSVYLYAGTCYVRHGCT